MSGPLRVAVKERDPALARALLDEAALFLNGEPDTARLIRVRPYVGSIVLARRSAWPRLRLGVAAWGKVIVTTGATQS